MTKKNFSFYNEWKKQKEILELYDIFSKHVYKKNEDINKAIIKTLILITKYIDRDSYTDYDIFCKTKANFHDETIETLKMLEGIKK